MFTCLYVVTRYQCHSGIEDICKIFDNIFLWIDFYRIV